MRGEDPVPPKYTITKSLRDMFKGEEVPGNPIWPGQAVRYLNAAERDAYKLTVEDGKLYDVAGAGELQVSNGELQLISDQSGHYHPTRDMKRQVMHELQSRGVPMDNVLGHLTAPP